MAITGDVRLALSALALNEMVRETLAAGSVSPAEMLPQWLNNLNATATFDPVSRRLDVEIPLYTNPAAHVLQLRAIVDWPEFRFEQAAPNAPVMRASVRMHIDTLSLNGSALQTAAQNPALPPENLLASGALLGALVPPSYTVVLHNVEVQAEFQATLVNIFAGRFHCVGFTIPTEPVEWMDVIQTSWLSENGGPYGGTLGPAPQSNALFNTASLGALLAYATLITAGLGNDIQALADWNAGQMDAWEPEDWLLSLLDRTLMTPFLSGLINNMNEALKDGTWELDNPQLLQDTQVPLTPRTLFCPLDQSRDPAEPGAPEPTLGADIRELFGRVHACGLVPPEWRRIPTIADHRQRWTAGWSWLLDEYDLRLQDEPEADLDNFLDRLLGVASVVEFDVLPQMEPPQSPFPQWPGVIEVAYCTAYAAVVSQMLTEDPRPPEADVLPYGQYSPPQAIGTDVEFREAVGRGAHICRAQTVQTAQAVLLLAMMQRANMWGIDWQQKVQHASNLSMPELPPQPILLDYDGQIDHERLTLIESFGASSLLRLQDFQREGNWIHDPNTGVPMGTRTVKIFADSDLTSEVDVYVEEFYWDLNWGTAADGDWEWVFGFRLAVEGDISLLGQIGLFLAELALPVVTISHEVTALLAPMGPTPRVAQIVLGWLKGILNYVSEKGAGAKDLLDTSTPFNFHVCMGAQSGRLKTIVQLDEPDVWKQLRPYVPKENRVELDVTMRGIVTDLPQTTNPAYIEKPVVASLVPEEAPVDAPLMVLGSGFALGARNRLKAPEIRTPTTEGVEQSSATVDPFSVRTGNIAVGTVPSLGAPEESSACEVAFVDDVAPEANVVVGLAPPPDDEDEEIDPEQEPVFPFQLVTAEQNPSILARDVDVVERQVASARLYAGEPYTGDAVTAPGVAVPARVIFFPMWVRPFSLAHQVAAENTIDVPVQQRDARLVDRQTEFDPEWTGVTDVNLTSMEQANSSAAPISVQVQGDGAAVILQCKPEWGLYSVGRRPPGSIGLAALQLFRSWWDNRTAGDAMQGRSVSFGQLVADARYLPAPAPRGWLLGPNAVLGPSSVVYKLETFRDWRFSPGEDNALLWDNQHVPLVLSGLRYQHPGLPVGWSLSIATAKYFVTMVSGVPDLTKPPPLKYSDLGFTRWELTPVCTQVDHTHHFRWFMVYNQVEVEIPSSSAVADSVAVPLPVGEAEQKNAIWVFPSGEGFGQAPGTLVVACFPGVQPFTVTFVCRCSDGAPGDTVSSGDCTVELSGMDTKVCTLPGADRNWNEQESPLPDPGPMAFDAAAQLMTRPVFIRLFGVPGTTTRGTTGAASDEEYHATTIIT